MFILSHLAQGLRQQSPLLCSRESLSGLDITGRKQCSTVNETLPLEGGMWAVKGTLPLSNPRMDAGTGKGQRNARVPTWASGSSVLSFCCLLHSPQPQAKYQICTLSPQPGLESGLGFMSTASPEPWAPRGPSPGGPPRVAGTCNLK